MICYFSTAALIIACTVFNYGLVNAQYTSRHSNWWQPSGFYDKPVPCYHGVSKSMTASMWLPQSQSDTDRAAPNYVYMVSFNGALLYDYLWSDSWNFEDRLPATTPTGEANVCASYLALCNDTRASTVPCDHPDWVGNPWRWNYVVMPASECQGLATANESYGCMLLNQESCPPKNVTCCSTPYCNKPGE